MDRNLVGCINRTVNIMSLSVRRAWIEILVSRLTDMSDAVALRKESVDRNRTPHQRNTRPIPSLSVRRAWIEIICTAWKRYLVIRRSP